MSVDGKVSFWVSDARSVMLELFGEEGEAESYLRQIIAKDIPVISISDAFERSSSLRV